MVLSVREALACIGHGSGSSVLGDLFGYGVVPKSLSLGDQLRRSRSSCSVLSDCRSPQWVRRKGAAPTPYSRTTAALCTTRSSGGRFLHVYSSRGHSEWS
jgi:hypothetical protein